MIRIMTVDGPKCITITVDAKLVGGCMDPVETCCNHAIARGKPVQLFLREVLTIDGSGPGPLCRLATKGFDLSTADIYSSYVVQVSRLDGPSHKARRR